MASEREIENELSANRSKDFYLRCTESSNDPHQTWDQLEPVLQRRRLERLLGELNEHTWKAYL